MQAGDAHGGGCAGGDEEAAPGTPPAGGARQPLARRKKAPRGKLGLLPLVALIFYEVSGGPFGTEARRPLAAVRASTRACMRSDSSGGPSTCCAGGACQTALRNELRRAWARVQRSAPPPRAPTPTKPGPAAARRTR